MFLGEVAVRQSGGAMKRQKPRAIRRKIREMPGFFHCAGHKNWILETGRSVIWPSLCVTCTKKILQAGVKVVDDMIEMACATCGKPKLVSFRYAIQQSFRNRNCGTCASLIRWQKLAEFDFETDRCPRYGDYCLQCIHEKACLESQNFIPILDFLIKS